MSTLTCSKRSCRGWESVCLSLCWQCRLWKTERTKVKERLAGSPHGAAAVSRLKNMNLVYNGSMWLFSTTVQRFRHTLDSFTMTSVVQLYIHCSQNQCSKGTAGLNRFKCRIDRFLIDTISHSDHWATQTLFSHPVVVLESAPITTPPSYSTAMMVVWRGERYRRRQMRWWGGKGTDTLIGQWIIYSVVDRWQCKFKTAASSMHRTFCFLSPKFFY